MRWMKTRYGDEKIKRKFAILPIRVENEVRWLEWVTVKYLYYVDKDCIAGWHAIEFIDKEIKRISGGQMHWIDNADSWICPVCGLEVSSPAKYGGCKCPQCGFQDTKDKNIL